jgi:hypothetical protein
MGCDFGNECKDCIRVDQVEILGDEMVSEMLNKDPKVRNSAQYL